MLLDSDLKNFCLKYGLKIHDILCNFISIKAMANEFCFRTMVEKINKKSNNFIWSDAIL